MPISILGVSNTPEHAKQQKSPPEEQLNKHKSKIKTEQTPLALLLPGTGMKLSRNSSPGSSELSPH